MSDALQAMPMLRCGCRAMSMGLKAGEDETLRRPACVVHDCFDVMPDAPDLSARRARCTYYGKMPRHNECNYGGAGNTPCQCEQPSDGPLPFFKYLGVGSPTSLAQCVCGFYASAHYPKWAATLLVDREWYKVGRKIYSNPHSVHARTIEEAATLMEQRADDFRRMTKDTYLGQNAHVYGVVVSGLQEVPNPLKCREFRPVGPADYDEFYCGCHSWD